MFQEIVNVVCPLIKQKQKIFLGKICQKMVRFNFFPTELFTMEVKVQLNK